MKVVFGGKDAVNRKAVEDRSVDILMSPEKNRSHDFMKSRNSGLNQVLCRLAHDNNVAIGFDFNYLLNAKDRIDVIGRMKFNVKLCSKYDVKMYVCNSTKHSDELRAESDLEAFGRLIGMKKITVKNLDY